MTPQWNVGPVRDVVAARVSDVRRRLPKCGHTEAQLTPNCHPGAPVFVRYDDAECVLIMSCSQCEHFVAKFKVAP